MKQLNFLFLALFFVNTGYAQVKFHSHNDYAGKLPLIEAYQNKADEIEADIFLVNGKLVVAHNKKEIDTTKTLTSLYLRPIATYFEKFNKRVSEDRNYTFSLMIDIKQDWKLIYPLLKKEIESFGSVFNRDRGKMNIQIVISGNRPPDSTYHSYPEWLFFDGLPNVDYAKADLKRVTMISDNFAFYSKWKGTGNIPKADADQLKRVIEAAHRLNKPIRFWGAPDTQDSWKQLKGLGADIINTDKVKESKQYLLVN